MPTPPSSTSKPKRYLRRALFALLGFAVVVVALWFLVLPPVLASNLRSALTDLGFADARFSISTVRPDRVELFDLSLGDGAWLTARRVEVTFSVTSLLAGEVLDIVIEAPLWNLRDAPPERRMPPFDELTPRSDMPPDDPCPPLAPPLPITC